MATARPSSAHKTLSYATHRVLGQVRSWGLSHHRKPQPPPTHFSVSSLPYREQESLNCHVSTDGRSLEEDFPSDLQTSIASLVLLFPHHSIQPWPRLKVGTKSCPVQSPKHSMTRSQNSLRQLINCLWRETWQQESQLTSVEVAEVWG